MNTQYADSLESGIPGFASLFAHASQVAGGAHQDQMSSPGTSAERKNHGNRNLSAVIARIRDDGPADTLAEDTVSWSSAGIADNPVPSKVSPQSSAGAEDKPARPRVDTGTNRGSTAPMARESASGLLRRDAVAVKKGGWQPFAMLLAFVIAGGMCIYLYTLVDQVDDIIRTLRQQGDQSRMTTQSEHQSSSILPLVSGLNDELKSLKSELRVIRDDYRNTEKKLSMKIPDDLSSQLMKISAAATGDRAVRENLERIRREMADMKKVIETFKTGMAGKAPSSDGVAVVVASTKTPETPQPVAGSWIVNLASLSSRDKAQQAVARLKATGVAPIIQQAVVNGEQIYRLSVAGFFSRDDATAFIHKARREFGFDGGWIRHG